MSSTSGDENDHASLGDMYSDYFLDYASYVILERAVPHLADGLKPVQRRILHSMRELHDGRYHKVANLVGNTMKYHPHGDTSIGDAMVQIGQKELLIDPQGNWGNIITGDRAAASRYIEARLTPLALEIAFNHKTTNWTPSYDGRNKEPITLPMKFPLVLAHGAEGIAVGLACKILPHNFIELIDASIAALRNEEFELYPDFLTGGILDATDYHDGLRGGRLRVRAKVEISSRKALRVSELPFGVTTTSLMDSIVSANEKGKLKISRLEDNTAATCDITIHLPAGADPETTRDALYAFSDCEVSISPNSCVISEGKPHFLGVTEILKRCAFQTKDLLKLELEIRLGELEDKWHFSSLEKIFIENRIYRDIEECETWEAVLEAIDTGLEPHKHLLKRQVTREDLIRLTEIKIKRISKYDTFRADEEIKNLEDAIAETEKHLRNLTRYTISYFNNLKNKYGEGRERKTRLSTFDKIDRSQVAIANETLYLDRKNGFAGYALKKEEAISKCSTLDDIVVFSQEGIMKIVKIADKIFVGPRPLHLAVFRKEEEKIYSLLYRDGKQGTIYAKRFRIGGITRDKEYTLTLGTPKSRILHFAVHDTEEESSENTVTIHLKPALRLRNVTQTFSFGDISIKGRGTRGNIVTKHPVDRITKAKNPV